MAPLASYLPDCGRHSGIIALGVVFLVAVFIYQSFFVLQYPSNLPLAGEPVGRRWFSLRTRWKYLTNCSALFKETYENYSKKGKTVLIPGIGVRHEIILPHSAMRWVLSQPDSALSVTAAFVDVDQVWYGLGHEKYISDPWQGNLVRTEMSSVLENLCAAMNDELGIALDKHFGTDTETWKDIDLLAMMRMVVAQASSRFTVGVPLCRDEQYLTECFKIVDNLVLNAGLTSCSPRIFQPIVGRLVSWRIPGYISKMNKGFEPLYRERLEHLKYDANDSEHPEPQDHLQMMLRYAQSHRPEELHDFPSMAKRLCAANFGSMHQTSIQATNMLLNILGSDTEFNTISVLRDEVNRVIVSEGGEWSRATVARMHKADSVARETMRLNSFGNRAVMRKVMVDGIVTEDGIELPKGSIVSFLGFPIQVDEERLEDPLKYDPFRFSRMREAAADADGKPGLNNMSFVSTSPQHLPFGHGKHACPGRFLVDFELKMIISYIFSNYDVEFPPEYKGKRPANIWVTEAILPPPGARIRVKRRKSS